MLCGVFDIGLRGERRVAGEVKEIEEDVQNATQNHPLAGVTENPTFSTLVKLLLKSNNDSVVVAESGGSARVRT